MTKKFKITEKESKQIERAFYELESDKAIVSIIAREIGSLSEKDDFKAEMLSYYASNCKKSFKRLAYIQDRIICKYIDRTQYPNVSFIFDFKNHEVKFNSD